MPFVVFVILAVLAALVLLLLAYLIIAGATGVPIAVGIAVKRYHLYHIDIIIKHTLVYVSLTLILGALFELDGGLLSGVFSEFTHPEL
jgi:hypothetical protein